MRTPVKLKTRKRHCLLFVTECCVLRGNFLARITPYVFISRTKMSIVFERVGHRIILLEIQQGKQSWRSKCSPSEPITAWVRTTKTLTKNRHSMTACGYCCYYLGHCSKINHIAIKQAKYKNVFGLSSLNMWLASCNAQNMSVFKFANMVWYSFFLDYTQHFQWKIYQSFLDLIDVKITQVFGKELKFV